MKIARKLNNSLQNLVSLNSKIPCQKRYASKRIIKSKPPPPIPRIMSGFNLENDVPSEPGMNTSIMLDLA